jgi:hypothetical protein
MGCNFSLKFRGPYVKIHRQWSFRVDCYEIRDPFWEVMDCKYIFWEVMDPFRGSYENPWTSSMILLYGRGFLQNGHYLADLGRPRARSDGW